MDAVLQDVSDERLHAACTALGITAADAGDAVDWRRILYLMRHYTTTASELLWLPVVPPVVPIVVVVPMVVPMVVPIVAPMVVPTVAPMVAPMVVPMVDI